MIRAAIIGLGWWGQTTASSLANSDIIKPVLGIDPLDAQRTLIGIGHRGARRGEL